VAAHDRAGARGATMVKDNASAGISETALRPLDLNPERA
jgi:hypothetical protein